ncbi:amidohydrolase family protein [Isoptericola sp. b490]|uniref:amidohydrolase n=1 Tax=Actinotalea lenta TaxID=3064654 RepID=UPI002712E8BD|nr:amidohydrolase family protein [Isoptericola sp. b490]MDO8122622.1 amidohydrolase family protein [Isoptericola sp. b490]
MTLLSGARLVPLDGGAAAGPVDLRVLDGVLAEVGPGLAPGRDEVVDLEGRWLLPGLWDAHAHVGQWATVRRRLDVSAARSAREAGALVTERLRAQPQAAGSLLVGYGYRDVLWDEPTDADVLDEAARAAGAPDVGVVLVCGDLHSGWISGVAAAVLGLSPGVLREEPWFAVAGRLDPDEATLDGWVAEATRAAAARGLVGVLDVEMTDNLRAWQRRIGAGHTWLRVSAGVWPDYLDGVLARELATGDVIEGTSGLLSQGPLKVITDGSLNTRTAYCHDAYPGPGGALTHGVLNVPPDELEPLMAAAARHGVHAAIHAIGDRANTLALDAFERTGARGSIEHAQLLAPADVPRFAALGVAASVQPEHLLDDRDAIDATWADRAGRCYPLRSLHEAGARLVLGSDAPVAPMDPWLAISAAATRARDGRAPWHPEQTVPTAVALASSVRSRLAPGEPADLVVLDADPLADPAGLRTMPVAGTMLAGRWTFRAG